MRIKYNRIHLVTENKLSTNHNNSKSLSHTLPLFYLRSTGWCKCGLVLDEVLVRKLFRIYKHFPDPMRKAMCFQFNSYSSAPVPMPSTQTPCCVCVCYLSANEPLSSVSNLVDRQTTLRRTNWLWANYMAKKWTGREFYAKSTRKIRNSRYAFENINSYLNIVSIRIIKLIITFSNYSAIRFYDFCIYN